VFLKVGKMNVDTQRLESKPMTIQLVSPLSGPVLAIEKVPDPVFAERVVGDGIAIDPTSQVLVAPVDGEIVQLHASHHAVAILTAQGIEILLHIGLDTVKLKGDGFTPLVKLGDRVKAGDELIRFDADKISMRAKSLISVMVITDAKGYTLKTLALTDAIAGSSAIAELTGTQAKTSTPAVAASGKAQSDEIRILLATGLHARPAALISSMAKKYPFKVEIQKGSQTANAKSVVSIMGLEINYGDSVRFLADGDRAPEAVKQLADFLERLEEKVEAKAETAPPPIVQVKSENVVVGVGASPGLAIGRVHQLRSATFEIVETSKMKAADEKTRLTRALKQAADELQTLSNQVEAKTDASQGAIFAAHRELLEDPEMIDLAGDFIGNGKTAEYAWNAVIAEHANRLANLNNELMANRANDLRDVGGRVLRALLGAPTANLSLPNATILIAENLTPSDTVQLDRNKVLGFCTTTGGATSHVAILARSLGLPAIAGIEVRALKITDGTEVVIDGDRGEIRLNPTTQEKAEITKLQEQALKKREAALSSATETASTLDGKHIEVAANIGGVADAQKAVEFGCDGVGLLRSEFLFLERANAPSEEEQYRVYQEIADIMGARPLTIRTLDVGGDKPLQYLPLPKEENPFLGIRGIRVGFMNEDILREQLRAILRVKTKGKLNIMFPMIAMIEEFRHAKQILEEERAKLKAPPVSVGIMIEVPSAALMANVFAKECDFFSIGTNDLTQYTLAMDRGHEGLAKQVDGLHPSVLRLIEMTVLAAHANGKWVGVCGGIAGDSKAVPILLGLGIDELSVSIPVIPLVKSQVRETSVMEAKKLATTAVQSLTAKDVRGLT
jgi:multiphosphoryl transfer protein